MIRHCSVTHKLSNKLIDLLVLLVASSWNLLAYLPYYMRTDLKKFYKYLSKLIRLELVNFRNLFLKSLQFHVIFINSPFFKQSWKKQQFFYSSQLINSNIRTYELSTHSLLVQLSHTFIQTRNAIHIVACMFNLCIPGYIFLLNLIYKKWINIYIRYWQ